MYLLLIVTAALFFYNSNSNKPKSNQFRLSTIDKIDRIEIDNPNGNIVLSLKGRQWKLNEKYTANIARMNDLFVILEKVNTRRKVGKEEQEKMEMLFESSGAMVRVFTGDYQVKQFKIVENDKGTLTYYIDEDGTGYICNISGYNYHIAQLFNLNHKGWRSNYIFSSNWTTLEKLEVKYPEEDGFAIRYDPSGYYIDNVSNLDSAKMYNYLEQISYLQVDQFLEEAPERIGKSSVNLSVSDAGEQSINLSFYKKGDIFYGSIDSIEWALFKPRDVLNLMKTKDWFEKPRD